MRARRAGRGLLLLGTAFMIVKLLATGQMAKYMAPGLDVLSVLTALVLFAMAGVELWAALARGQGAASPDESSGPRGIEEGLTATLLLLVMLVGFAVTPRALGTSGLGGERITGLLLAFAPGPGTGEPPAAPLAAPLEGHAAVLAHLRQAGLAALGQSVRLAGSVVKGNDLGADEAALLRYAIVHCVADARPVALVVVASPGAALPADQWVEIEGVLAARERGGARLVAIEVRRITPIEEPANPYLSGF